MLKKATLAAMLMAATTVSANDFSVEVGGGKLYVDDIDDGTALHARAGYNWSENLGMELGYVKGWTSDTIEGVDVRGKARAWMLGANVSTNRELPLFVGARAGRYWGDTTVKASAYMCDYSDCWHGRVAESDSAQDWYYGAYAGYNISDSWSTSLDYTRYHGDFDLDTLTLGVKYSF